VGTEGSPRAVYRFDGFTLDLVRGALLGPDGAEIPLRPKAFSLLRHFVENAGRLLDRDEILAAVWPGVFVTEDSVGQCLKEARRALGDEQQRLLRTVPRRGYLFAAEVARLDAASPLLPRGLAGLLAEPLRPPPAATAAPSSVGEPAPPRSGHSPEGDRAAASAAAPAHRSAASRPMLVVLPFANMTGDAEQEYFADGIAEELTTALSHLRWFSVVARNSAFTYKGRAVDVRQVGRELGVGYVLEGSVRKAGGRVRITAQLCDASAGQHVWAQRFDGDLADIFDLQDRVTEAVAGAIEPSLRLAEVERARAKPTESLTAYDLYLRALPHRFATREGNEEALRLLRRAVALDPGFAAAKGALANLHTVRFTQGWAEEGDVEEAVRCARDVIERGGEDDPTALAAAALALAYLARDHEAGLGAADRALLLAPNAAQVLLFSGWIRTYAGDARTAIAQLERAMRLSPVDPSTFYFATALAFARFVGGDLEGAAALARRAVHDRPSFLTGHRLLAACLAQLGRSEEAAEAVRALLAVAPGYTVADAAKRLAVRDRALRGLYLDGLRRAGLPEG
jgi:adenylate cyclase